MGDDSWGLWLDPGELETILGERDHVLSAKERTRVLDTMKASNAGPQDPIPCPVCKKTMEHIHYDESVHVVLDQCAEHGIWCDTGEIKKIEAVSDTSEQVHQMVLKKLGLDPQ